MSCPEYDRLRRRLKVQQDAVNQFSWFNRKRLSPVQEKQERDVAQQKAVRTQQLMTYHRLQCDACRQDDISFRGRIGVR